MTEMALHRVNERGNVEGKHRSRTKARRAVAATALLATICMVGIGEMAYNKARQAVDTVTAFTSAMGMSNPRLDAVQGQILPTIDEVDQGGSISLQDISLGADGTVTVFVDVDVANCPTLRSRTEQVYGSPTDPSTSWSVSSIMASGLARMSGQSVAVKAIEVGAASC